MKTTEVISELLARPLLDEAQVARCIPGLRRRTLQAMRRRGDGPPFFKIGKRFYVRTVDLRAWIDAKAGGMSHG